MAYTVDHSNILKNQVVIDFYNKEYVPAAKQALSQALKLKDEFAEISDSVDAKLHTAAELMGPNGEYQELFDQFARESWIEFQENDWSHKVAFEQLGRTSSFYIRPRYYKDLAETLFELTPDKIGYLYDFMHELVGDEVFLERFEEIGDYVNYLDDEYENETLFLEDLRAQLGYYSLDDLVSSLNQELRPELQHALDCYNDLEDFKKNQVANFKSYLLAYLEDDDLMPITHKEGIAIAELAAAKAVKQLPIKSATVMVPIADAEVPVTIPRQFNVGFSVSKVKPVIANHYEVFIKNEVGPLQEVQLLSTDLPFELDGITNTGEVYVFDVTLKPHVFNDVPLHVVNENGQWKLHADLGEDVGFSFKYYKKDNPSVFFEEQVFANVNDKVFEIEGMPLG